MKIAALVLLSGAFCWGQTDECKPSTLNVPGAQFPCVYPDHRATFRLVAPDAHKVQVRVGQASIWSRAPAAQTVEGRGAAPAGRGGGLANFTGGHSLR